MAEFAGFTPAPLNQQPLSFGAPHVAPPFDVIELLPEERKDLLRKLRQRADDARALAVPFEDVRAASMERVEKGKCASAASQPPAGFWVQPARDRSARNTRATGSHEGHRRPTTAAGAQ
jgi:hypothetical protein